MPLYEHVFLARQDASTQQVEELTTQMTGIVEGLGGMWSRYVALIDAARAAGQAGGPGTAGAYDMGRLLAEGIARAHGVTREAIAQGLDRVKSLPSATGRPDTLMGFGRFDRGALKGQYLVIRQWRDGSSVEW